MSTLRGIFPEPKKEQKKNFIKENVKQLKYIQGKTQPKYVARPFPPRMSAGQSAEVPLNAVKSSPSSKTGKFGVNVAKPGINARKKIPDVKIKKGDMAEFLRRKEQLRQGKTEESEEEVKSEESLGRLKDVACQTMESNLAQKLDEITMLYPKRKMIMLSIRRAEIQRNSTGLLPAICPAYSHRKAGDELNDHERPRSRLNAILERKDQNKDPYLPSGYQKGVLPKYLRERKDQGIKEAEGVKAADDGSAVCPPGHVTLPDTERKETLRMLRNSFAELVSELNKMPVRTDTLRMRNRKMELEKQLAKLEEGIKVFSRPKVFVKIGE
ncbi:calmodulin-binding domain-containing protein [Phthorimaea operculella]|nr:calmodulin-binding domain-containing protein [Phthorimaea operculella]